MRRFTQFALLTSSLLCASARCLPAYECRISADVGGVSHLWDLSPLCLDGPDQSPPSAIGSCAEWAPVTGAVSVCATGADRIVRTAFANFTFNICESGGWATIATRATCGTLP